MTADCHALATVPAYRVLPVLHTIIVQMAGDKPYQQWLTQRTKDYNTQRKEDKRY